jgi:hypothetical protein
MFIICNMADDDTDNKVDGRKLDDRGKRGKGKLGAYWERVNALSPEERAAEIEMVRARAKATWEERKRGKAYDLLTVKWRNFVDMLPGCRWDYNLVMKKCGGLPARAKQSISSYLNEHPVLVRAIEEKRESCCPSSIGSVTDKDLDESERLRRKVMSGLENIADVGESEANRLKAFELLGRTMGLFQDKVEMSHQFAGYDPDGKVLGSAEGSRQRLSKIVESRQLEVGVDSSVPMPGFSEGQTVEVGDEVP